MKNITKIFFAIAVIGLFIMTSCTNQKQLVGNDKDEHGCIASAGYSWCEPKQKCIRSWEENCTTNNQTENNTNLLGGEVSKK